LPELVIHVFLAGATVLAWLGVGSIVLAPLPPVSDRLLDLLNRIGAGSIAFALVTFAVGWAGYLDPAAYRVVLAVSAAAGLTAATRLSAGLRLPRPRTWRRWELAFAALLTAYAGLGILAVSAPVSSPDALLYHSADPALFERQGEIVEVPWNASSYEPFTVEMLVLDGTLLWDPVQGAYAPFLLGLLALAGVMGATARVLGRSASLLAGAIFFAQPFLTWETTSVFVEPGIAAMVALAGWNLVRFVAVQERAALVLAGAFAGGAAGMKYLGLVVALCLGVAGLAATWRRLAARDVFLFAVPAMLVALPWYVKNAILTGNPFYPHLFGGLNASAAEELERTLREDFGHGRGLIDLILLPLRLLADGDAFDGGEFVSPLFLAFLPAGLLLVSNRGNWKLAVGSGVTVFVGVWFATTQQARFLLPAMPVLAVVASAGILALIARGRTGRLVSLAAVSAALAAGLAAASVYAFQFAGVVLGTESRAEFLQRKVSLYEGVDWLNRNLVRDDRVAVSFWSLLYLEVPYVTFGTMGDELPPDAGITETRAFARRHRLSHVAILDNEADRRRQVTYLDARLIARVPVRSVRSRTRAEFGPPRTMLVYRVDGERRT